VAELLSKLEKAMHQYPVKMVGLCGGVSANSALRTRFTELGKQYNEKLFVIPEMKYCGDNAAMIGAAAYYLKPLSNIEAGNKLECYPNISIIDFMKENGNLRRKK